MGTIHIIQGLMTKGMTPKGIVKSIVGRNPIVGNLIDMAERGGNQGVENFARNLLKERGLDFDTEMNKFKNQLNMK